MRYQGTLTEWNDEQGYGFITPDEGRDRVFVHIKAYPNRQQRPEMGEVMHYELTTDARGRQRAARVSLADTPYAKDPSSGWSQHVGTVYVLVVVVILVGAVLLGRLPIFVPAVYTVLSLLAFGAYGKDKWAAKSGRWRTAESALHLLGLLGGWPGAFVAQRMFRHKTSKRSFQVTFWFTVLLNTALLVGMLSPQGDALLHQYFVDSMWLR